MTCSIPMEASKSFLKGAQQPRTGRVYIEGQQLPPTTMGNVFPLGSRDEVRWPRQSETVIFLGVDSIAEGMCSHLVS